MRYVVTVAGQTVELEIERSADGGYRVHGAAGSALEVAVLASNAGVVELLVNGQTILAQPAEHEVRFRQQRYPARAENALQRAQARSVAAGGASSKELVASMPGRIVRVACEVGGAVIKGTPLIVMEAMKMQNELCAKVDGVVRAVRVSVGETVERGAVLLELE